MKIIYSRQDISNNIGPSIFLAGPTPRDASTKSWRPKAIELLKKLGFEGTVFLPEDEDGKWKNNYDDQIAWEWKGLETATCIVFWIPRELNSMPAFTTNIEWGKWYESGKVVLGYPENAPKISYLKYCADKNNISVSDNLSDTLKSAIAKLRQI